MNPHEILEAKIRKSVVQAISDYQMLEPEDKVLVAVSGGKDSSTLLLMLEQIRQKAPYPFTLEAVLLDQKQPGFSATAFTTWVKTLGVPFTLLEEDTYSIVVDKVPQGQTYCSLCSRLRRGILYTYAAENGFTKVALGHHRDDLNQSVLMSMFYSGRLAGMPPKLRSDDGRNTLIRPLCYVAEKQILEFAQGVRFPIIPCNLCGSQEGLKRARIKKWLQELEAENENISANLLASLQNIRPSQLMDKNLWDFEHFDTAKNHS